MKKRIYEMSLIGLGVGAVAVLAFGLAHRAGKLREESADTSEPLESRELALAAAEGEALSSQYDLPLPAGAEPPQRDEAMAEIWGADMPNPEREELLELSSDLTGELETRGDTYDGIEPEDMGAEWLARATEAYPNSPQALHRGGALSTDEPLSSVTEESDEIDIDEEGLGRA